MTSLKFFLSYTQADRKWAEWIAWQVEAAGHEVRIQAWDFPTGSNFLSKMDEATRWADVTLMVLSESYLASEFCKIEWYAGLVDDPVGEKRALLPFRVGPCQPTGLLKAIVYADLVGLGRREARQRVLAELERGRLKPDAEPLFPGDESSPGQPESLEKPPQAEPLFPAFIADHPNPETRALAEQLAEAYETLHEQEGEELDTQEIRSKILKLRRNLRDGGLKKGYFLVDGRYKLIRKIGKGGFAQVWKAYDRQKRRHVAIKVLHLQYSEDQTRRERFARGAARMAELRHAHVVPLLEESCEDGGYHFFVMEYVAGGDFQQAVKAGNLSLDDRWRIILKVGEALQHAHDCGVIHRDVKPANILLDEGLSPKLTDFDLVRAAETSGGTRTGAMGTFVYAAPEMLHRPQDAEPTVDVYGLGMTAIFALCGKDLTPHVFRDAERFLKNVEAPSEVKAVLARAVEWEVEDRWPSVRAFCETLAEALSGHRDESALRADFVDHGQLNPIEVTIVGALGHREPHTLDGARSILLAGQEWQEAMSEGRGEISQWLAQELAGLLTKVMQFRHLPAPERHKAGLIASDLGDLPADLDAFVTLPEAWLGYPFEIGKYPVTNAQYQRFIEEGGYEREITEIGSRSEPRYWKDRDFNRATQPVVGVNWYEAEAYCQWLTAKLRASGEIGKDQIVRLPTFEEREKAAAGPEGRKFPWGNEEDVRYLNCEESEIKNPSSVHMYPDGVSPEGVWDLSGNVWEWTGTEEKKDYTAYVLAGGAFYKNISLNTSVARDWGSAGLVWRGGGFRVSVSPLLP